MLSTIRSTGASIDFVVPTPRSQELAGGRVLNLPSAILAQMIPPQPICKRIVLYDNSDISLIFCVFLQDVAGGEKGGRGLISSYERVYFVHVV